MRDPKVTISLPRLAIDFRPDNALFQRLRHEQVIDAHAEVFMKIARAVVPPRVPPGFRVMQSVRVDEPRARQPRKRLPLALRHMRPAMTGDGVPHIDIVGRHIKVTADDGRCLWSDGLLDPASQPVELHELRFIEWRIHVSPVRRVHTDDVQAAALGSKHPHLSQRFMIAAFRRLTCRKDSPEFVTRPMPHRLDIATFGAGVLFDSNLPDHVVSTLYLRSNMEGEA